MGFHFTQHTKLGAIRYFSKGDKITEPIFVNGSLSWRWYPPKGRMTSWLNESRDENGFLVWEELSLKEVEAILMKPLPAWSCDLNCSKHYSFTEHTFIEENRRRKF